KLASVLDSLESKFGETAVMSGALWQRFHGDNGTRRKRSELKSAVDARGDAPSNTADDIPSNTADDTSTNEDAQVTEKKEPKKF
ncbi:MAG: DNA polymerase IV, partial [Veillonella sp.]|nr:DNA polymerase IV [Veillonella sp.]